MKTLTLLTFLSLATVARAATPPVLPAAIANSSTAPTGFEENKGQVRTTEGEAAPFVRYRLSQGNTQLFLLGNGIAYQFSRMHYPDGYEGLVAGAGSDSKKQEQMDAMRKQIRLETYRMDMLLEGADASARITTEGRSEDYTQYYNHDALDVHTYSKVTYHEIYPGIDWVVYTTEKGMKYDFVVRPGADPDQIRLRFEHYEELSLDADGNLIHGNRMGRFTEERPVSFQDGKEVPTSFVLEGNTLRFALENYDRSQALTIDPDRIWATYYGGTVGDGGYATAIDAGGNVYLAGYTNSVDAIASGGHQDTYGGGGESDAFLAKFNSSGTRLWATYYGGQGQDMGYACKVDGSNNVYLAGHTRSSAGIATAGAYQTALGSDPGTDGFLVKFDAVGTRLWGTYYGGSSEDKATGCAIDASDNVYVTGWTKSANGIAWGGHQNVYGGGGAHFDAGDAFLVKFNSTGERLWATYYGGSEDEIGNGCAVNSSDEVYMCGWANSPNAIASGGHQNTYAGGGTTSLPGGDAFLVKFSASGVRQWGTYYGGSDTDKGQSCAVDGSDNVYMAGTAYSLSGIASGGHQNAHAGGGPDGYLVKFNTNGFRLWATYYGGEGYDYANGCATDGNNNVYLAGTTGSSTGISLDGSPNSGAWEGYLVKFNSNGTRQWGTYYGGPYDEYANACTTDGDNHVYLTGLTGSLVNIASGGHQNTFGGSPWDAYLVKFEGGGPIDLGCATAQTAETEPNNSVGASNPLTYGTPISGDMGVCLTTDNTSDYFGFTTTGQGVLRVEACLSNSGPTALNVTFRVLNTGGTTLDTYILQAGANNAVATGEFLFPCRGIGSYHIAVDNPSTTVCTHYAFSYTILPPVFGNDPEPNDGIGASATPLAHDTYQDGHSNFDLDNSYDYYSITLPTNGVLNIETQAEHAGAAPSTMAVVLLNAVGSALETWNVAVGANGTAVTNTMSTNCRSTVSTYYIQINSAACGTSYRLKYTVTAPHFAADVEPNDSQPGTPLAHNTYTEGQLQFEGESPYDYYRIIPPTNGIMTFEVEAEHVGAVEGTMTIVLLNTVGTPLGTWNVPVGANGTPVMSTDSLTCIGNTNYDLRLSTGTCGTSYKLKWVLTPTVFTNDVEPNNSTSQAIVLLETQTAQGNVSTPDGDNTDNYRVDLSGDGMINVLIEAEHAGTETTGIVTVALYISNSTVLETWTAPVGAGSIPISTALSHACLGNTMPYYLRVSSNICLTSYRVSYTLAPALFAADVEPNDAAPGTSIAHDTYAEGHLEFFNLSSYDYYNIVPPINGAMVFEVQAEHAGAVEGTMQVQLSNTVGTPLETWTIPVGANGLPITSTLSIPCLSLITDYDLRLSSTTCGVSYRFKYTMQAPVFADDVEPNNSAPGTPLANDTYTDGHLSFYNESSYDYYNIIPPTNGALTFEVQAEQAGAIPDSMQVQLDNTVGTPIQTWVIPVGANGIPLTSTFSINCLKNTTDYDVRLFAYGCGTSYRLKYTVQAPVFANDVEPNNSTSEPTIFPLATPMEGQINFDNDENVDYYRIDLPTDGVLNVTIEAEHAGTSITETLAAYISVSTSAILATWNPAVGASSSPTSTSFSLSCRGTNNPYYLSLVSNVCGVSYRVSWTVTAPVFANDPEPNNGGPGTPMDLNTGEQQGHIGFYNLGDPDYFGFTHPGGAWSVTVSAEHAGTGEGTMTMVVAHSTSTVYGTFTVPVGGSSTAAVNTFSIPSLPASANYYLIMQEVTCGVSYMIHCNSDDDGDGICNIDDLCPGGPEPGTACDDGNPGTINDEINNLCECVGDLTTGLEEAEGPEGLRAWPNPAHTTLFLSTTVDAVVYDAQGRAVRTVRRENAIPLDELAPGVYLLRTLDGRMIRFVRE